MVATDGQRSQRAWLRWWVALVLLLPACAGTSSALARAGPDRPSKQAQMICAPEAQNEVGGALGFGTARAATATWTSPLYTCRYEYPEGTIVLSVRELADLRATIAHVDALALQLGRRSAIGGLGQGAFDTPDDSIVVRKDDKVLQVDVSRMPARFGTPAVSRSEAAIRIAIVIMGCWKGN